MPKDKQDRWNSNDPPKGFIWSAEWERKDEDERTHIAREGIYVAVTGRAYLNMQEEIEQLQSAQKNHLLAVAKQREYWSKLVDELHADMNAARKFIGRLLRSESC